MPCGPILERFSNDQLGDRRILLGRSRASGPKIDLPGRILAGLLPENHQNRPSGRRADSGSFPVAVSGSWLPGDPRGPREDPRMALGGLPGAPGPPRARVNEPKNLYFLQGPTERPSNIGYNFTERTALRAHTRGAAPPAMTPRCGDRKVRPTTKRTPPNFCPTPQNLN